MPEADPTSTTPKPVTPPKGPAGPQVGATAPTLLAGAIKASELGEETASVPGYEILAELGRGGMGVVYQARQVRLNRIVALKVIRHERLAVPEAVRRFRREAQAAARLSHPNIVMIHDADQAGDVHYLSMEYVEGVNLQRLVHDSGPLVPTQACDYVRQTALGLQHAFEQGLVHRDIKPANLIVAGLPGAARAPELTSPTTSPGGPWGLVKILDMGLARQYQPSFHQDLPSSLTLDGVLMGTPDFIAPEQAEDPKNADIRADLYSLGCSFYFLLTGQVPFPETKLLAKLDKHRWEEPPPVLRLRPSVPPGAAQVLRKLMAKRPEHRFQTPAEVATALEPFCRTDVLLSSMPPSVQAIAPLRGGGGGIPPFHHAEGTTTTWERVPGYPANDAEPNRIDAYAPLAGPVGEYRRFRGHANWVKCVAFSPDGRQLASAGADQTIRIWDIEYAEESRRLDGHAALVTGIAYAPDGRGLFSCGADKCLRQWDLQTGREVRRYDGHEEGVRSLTLSADGRLLLSASGNLSSKSRDNTVRLWDVETGQELRRYEGHDDQINTVAFAPDHRHFVSGSHDETVRLWELETGRRISLRQGHAGCVWCAVFSPDGRHVLYAGDTICLWELDSPAPPMLFEGHADAVFGVAFAPDGQSFLSSGLDGTIRLWSMESRQEVRRFEEHRGKVTCVAISADGRRAASCGADKTVRIWTLPR